MSERLDNVENQRRDFISNASHELKTPLSSIKILAESLLYQENVPEEMYKEFLTDINAEIDRLNSLLTDLLTLAQADNPAMVMRMTWENLDEIIAECIHSLQPLAQEKNIKINHIWNGVSMRCDRLKMSTALINLISNGIKYTPPEGSVTVEVEEQSQFIIITVSDTGIGIPQEEQAHVFERFYRVDRARARDTGGTGLGLAIVQQVVRLHGGEIMLTSTEKSGSTFTITMPQGRPEA
ncbi:MAG: sensor histidine kinase [Christensenellales bacterium]